MACGVIFARRCSIVFLQCSTGELAHRHACYNLIGLQDEPDILSKGFGLGAEILRNEENYRSQIVDLMRANGFRLEAALSFSSRWSWLLLRRERASSMLWTVTKFPDHRIF